MLELATKTQWPEVCRLAAEVHALHAQWRPDIYFSTPEPYLESDYLQAIRDRLVYVAKLNQSVVGYVTLSIHRKEGSGVKTKKLLRVDSICVEQMLRGQGIGRAMMEDVKALAKAFGCHGLLLSVHPENDGAIAFYQKCGFMIRTIQMDVNF